MGKKDVKETEQEKELAKVSIERWNDHQERMVPLENKVIENAGRATNAAKMKAAGVVNADIAQASGPAIPMNPNSGRAVSGTPALRVASQTAQAQVNAAQNVEDQRAHALGNVVRMGEGKSAIATAGFETAAANASSKAINTAAMKQSGREAMGSAIGTVAAAGAYAATKPKAAGNISQWEPGSEGRRAVYDGASGGPNGYHIRDNGGIYWNDQ